MERRNAQLEADIEAMQPEMMELIRTLCAIPAPSRCEQQRAAFIRDWFRARGMEAWIDEAGNVLTGMGLETHEPMTVIMAHTDTVFPDREPMQVRECDGRMYCPGVGDDTCNLAAMMMLAERLHKAKYRPKCGVLFVADVCEEGLGNLDGCKAIMRAYGPRVKEFLALDGGSARVSAYSVGSVRYKITAQTAGGHSFAAFGSRSAIEVLARLTCALYEQEVPKQGNSRTTYNVGLISGGTSVNTIAQSAEMLYEYRSDSAACLETMGRQLEAILAAHVPEDAQVTVETLGMRPCMGDVDEKAHAELIRAAEDALEWGTGRRPGIGCGSTDCNIPLSMGIPSVCFGVYIGEGAHTREEWIQTDSVCSGMKAAAQMLMRWFEA